MAHASAPAPSSLLASSYLPPAQADTFLELERWYYANGVHPIYLSLGLDDERFFALVDALNLADAVSVDAAGRHLCRGLPLLEIFQRIGALPELQQKPIRELFARYAAVFRMLPDRIHIPWAPTSRHLKAAPVTERPFDETVFGMVPTLAPYDADLRRARIDGTALVRMRLLVFFAHPPLGMHPELQKLLGKVSDLPGPAVEIVRGFVGK